MSVKFLTVEVSTSGEFCDDFLRATGKVAGYLRDRREGDRFSFESQGKLSPLDVPVRAARMKRFKQNECAQ